MTAPALMAGGTSPFTLTWLGEAVRDRMVEVFEGFKLPNPDPEETHPGENSAVTVYLGSIKSRQRACDGTEDAARFPLVLVQPRACVDGAGEDGARSSLASVHIMLGARRIGNDGHLDITAMVDRIRRSLLTSPIIASRARLELPLESEIGEDDSFPQWIGVVSVTFSIPQPVEEEQT